MATNPADSLQSTDSHHSVSQQFIVNVNTFCGAIEESEKKKKGRPPKQLRKKGTQ
jgi:hypothetical protein